MSFNPADVEPITARDLININDLVTNGDPRIRDIHLLESAIRRPYITLFGEPQFPTLIDKAAALMHSLAYHHLFVDGNKRTAIRSVSLFLERNGWRWDYEPERDAPFVLAIAQGKHDPEAISAWLAERVTRE